MCVPVVKSAGLALYAAVILAAAGPGCAQPFAADLDYIASPRVDERFIGMRSLKRLLETGKVEDDFDRAMLMRRVFQIAADQDEHPQTVMLALELAGRFGGVAAVQVLIMRSESSTEHWPIRQEAVVQLGRFPVPESMNALIHAIERDTEPCVRQEAVRSLGECGNEKCWRALVAAAVGNPDPSVRYTACRALEKQTGLKFGINEARWEKWWAERGQKKK